MTDPKELWKHTLDYLRTAPGVQGVVTADWMEDGSTVLASVDKSGTVRYEGTDREIIRAVVLNDIPDLPDQIASLVADFRAHIFSAGLPPTAYVRGDGVNDPEVFSSPLIIDKVPARIMALNHRIRARWLVTLDTFVRKPVKPQK